MKKFQFPLEPVLVWRDRLVEDERRQLSVLMTREAQISERHERVKAQLGERVEHAAVDAADLHRYAGYKDHLKTLEIVLKRESDTCRASVLQQRAKCVAAQRQHKMLEKLKYSRYLDWKRAVDLDSENQSNETFTANWSRLKRS